MTFGHNQSQTVWMGLSFLAMGLMAGILITSSSFEGGGFADLLTNDGGAADAPEAAVPDIDVNELETVIVSSDDDAVLGNSEAPITIVEFSDFQCPYCQDFREKTLPGIIENYIDEGIVQFVYRDFPLPSHTEADDAAKAAECVRIQAGENGDEAFFEMHDSLFENVSKWSRQTDPTDVLVSLAEDLGYDGDVLRTCMASTEIQDEINADYTAGKSYGISGTPTFFINGKKLVGAWPYEVFEKVIESLL